MGDISVTALRLITEQDNNPLTIGWDTTPHSSHKHNINKAEDNNHSDKDKEERNNNHNDLKTESKSTA